MKTVVYYFTGTGNSLDVAEGLSRALGNCEPSRLPALVADFAARLNPEGVSYVFAVVTMGGSGGFGSPPGSSTGSCGEEGAGAEEGSTPGSW